MSIRLRAIRLACRIALRKPPPPSIPMGQAGFDNDYWMIVLSTQRFGRFFVKGMNPSGLDGTRLQTPSAPAEENSHMPDAQIAIAQFRAERFLRGGHYIFRSPWRFLWAVATLEPTRLLRSDRIEQQDFNAKTLVRADRLNILRHFLEQTIQDPEYKASSIQLATEFHSVRWVRHPQESEIAEFYDLVLASLVASGDLEKADIRYKLKPQALVTLSHFDEERGRHRDSQVIQRRIAWLTGVVAFIALLQVGVTVWEELNPDPAAAKPEAFVPIQNSSPGNAVTPPEGQ